MLICSSKTMASFLIPVLVIALSVVAVLILWWIAYPFLLRYKIDTTFTGSTGNATNGNNGLSGAPGKNAPTARQGNPGCPGLSTPGGINGVNGRAGNRGSQGVPGVDGKVGADGANGPQGVPGYGAIPVREQVFDTSAPTIYFVNGVPLTDHTDNLSSKMTQVFNINKARLTTRVQNNFKKIENRNFFQNVLDLIVENPAMIDVDPEVLDTLDKFNTFMDGLAAVYTPARNNVETVTATESVIIQTKTTELSTLRALRTEDLAKIESDTYTLMIRTAKLSPYIGTLPMGGPYTRFDTIITELTTMADVTIDSKIRELTALLSPQVLILNSSSSTVAQKNAANIEICNINTEINTLQNVKELICVEKEADKTVVLEAYKMGTDISMTTSNGVTFSDYGPDGGDNLKMDIDDAREAINTAIAGCTTDIDTYLSPYKTKN